jgi:hypothetical protein
MNNSWQEANRSFSSSHSFSVFLPPTAFAHSLFLFLYNFGLL